MEPEEFCDRLERLLNASPQPCLIGFLKVTAVIQNNKAEKDWLSSSSRAVRTTLKSRSKRYLLRSNPSNLSKFNNEIDTNFSSFFLLYSCLLQKSLPLLRQSLVTKELIIEGINPPSPHVAFSTGPTPPAQATLAGTNMHLVSSNLICVKLYQFVDIAKIH